MSPVAIGARRRLLDLAAVAAVFLVLAVFSATTAWIPLVLEGAALAVLFGLRPRLGLVLVVASIPFAYAIQEIGPAEVSANDLLLLAATAGWALRALISWRRRGDLSPVQGWQGGLTGIDWAVFFFLFVCLASLAVGNDKRSALWELRILALQPFLLYVLLRSEALSGEELLHLADAWVLGAVLLATIGLYHFFVLHYVEAAEGVRRLLIPFYDSPNHIGLFLGRAAPVAMAMVVYGRGRLRRGLHGIALGTLLLAIYLTYSRGAWLVGLPAALLIVLLLPQLIGRRPSRRVLYIAAGLLMLGVLALLPVVRTARFATLTDLQSGTSFLRLMLWMGALRMIAAHPLLGVGIGNFAAQYPHFMLPEAWREPLVYHPHNLLLDFWAILGLPGLAALVWLQVAFWRTSLTAYRRLANPALQALILGLMGSMLAFLAHGLVDTAYFLADLAMVFMLTLALTVRLRETQLREVTTLQHNSLAASERKE